MTKIAGARKATPASDQQDTRRPRTNDHIIFGITSILAITSSAVLVQIIHGSNYRYEIFLAWFANVVQAGLAFWINRSAVGTETTRFMIVGMGVNFLRVVFILALIVAANKIGMDNFYPFLTATLCSFIVFMCGEILVLHTRHWPVMNIRRAAGGEA